MRGSPWPAVLSAADDFGTTPFAILAIMPWLNLAYSLTLYPAGSLGRVLRMFHVQTRNDAEGQGDGAPINPQETTYLVVGKRQVVTVLQLLVGSIVTFGGTAFTLFAVNSFGTALGSVHLLIGIVGLYAGILSVRKKSLPRRFLLASNSITIFYSALSVSIAVFQSLLPAAALHDSLIGTAIAIAVSGLIIFFLPRT